MKHFIYKTTHKNGKYYVGRHSTEDLNDGYIGSGTWPTSIKDKSTLSREIVEYAATVEEVIELEGKYLKEHFGKPNCMNGTDSPVGWQTGGPNPMKDPEIVAGLSGDNHYMRKDPVARENASKWQNDLVEKGEHIFQTDNPNFDGRNAKAAMANGTHINLGENNPAKKWSRDGTHPWFKQEDGTSIGAITNEKRIEEGTHNFLGPELNEKRIEDGSHNFLGSSQNDAMLKAGTHPSQQKKTCECCGWVVSSGMYKRWHGFGICHMDPASPRYNPNLKQR